MAFIDSIDMFVVLNEIAMPQGSLSTIRILGEDVVGDSAASRNLAGPPDLWRIIKDLKQATRSDDARRGSS